MREEHDVQIKLLTAFEEAARLKRPRRDLERIIHQLIDYSGVHFLSEELLMRMYAYPGYEDHEQRHHTLMEQMNVLQESLLKEQSLDLCEIAAKLKSLLLGHIDNEDAALSSYLKRGIKPGAS